MKKYLFVCKLSFPLHKRIYNLLADVVITKTEQPDNTSPGRNNLACELTTAVLPVRTETQDRAENSKPDSVAQDNGVISILPRLVLGLLLLSSGTVTDFLGGFLNLLFALLTGGLCVSLDRLRFVVRGDGGDVRAVNVDERGNRILGVFNLGQGRGATAFTLVSGHR